MESLYQFLQSMGYTHPLHAPITHVPIGLVIAVFLFGFFSLILRREFLTPPAYRSLNVLALVFLLPTVLFGYADWVHFYRGAWSFPIKAKIILSAVLLVLLVLAVLAGRGNRASSVRAVLVYALCFATVSGLGFYGGEIVFAGTGQETVLAANDPGGDKVYAQNCAMCHPRVQDLVKTTPMADVQAFLSFVRQPRKPDGSPSLMPAFPVQKLPEGDARAVYRYIREAGG